MSPKESAAAFNEIDANCNTCVQFHRLPHQREPARFLRGECHKAPRSHPLMYRRSGNEFWVHPADFMGMGCWEPRAAREARATKGGET